MGKPAVINQSLPLAMFLSTLAALNSKYVTSYTLRRLPVLQVTYGSPRPTAMVRVEAKACYAA